MNISSLNTLAGTTPRPVAAEASAIEGRQAARAPQEKGVAALTEQALKQTQKPEASREEVEDAVKQVNDFLQPINNSLRFTLDDDTGKTIVKVIDKNTDEVVRQFPSEEMLDIAKAIDKMKGLLIQQKA